MKKIMTRGMSVGFLVVVASLAFAIKTEASNPAAPIANLTEQWTTDPHWSKAIDGTATVVNEALQLGFAQKSIYDFTGEMGLIYANDTASDGRFVGNYAVSGITDVSFDIKRNALRNGVSLILFSSTGRSWSHSVPDTSVDGAFANVTLPLVFSAEWASSETTATPDMWAADLTCVTKIGLYAERSGSAAQAITLDNFKVVGPWGGTFVGGVPESWLLENKLGTGPGVADQDADHDGMSNLAEFLAGTDPNNASSVFRVDIVRNADGKAAVSWQHEKGQPRTFHLLASADLTNPSGFDTKATLQSVAATDEVVVDEQGEGPYFYKVQIDPVVQ